MIEVPPGETVYENVKDDVFLRIADENRRLTYAQRQELLYDRGHGSYEGRVVDGSSTTELDHNLLVGYATALGHPDPERLLRARGLAVDEQLTVAGVVLFAEHPQRFLPESFIRVLHYSGSDRGTGARQRLIRDESVEGPIARQLIRAREVIQEEQPRRRALAGSGAFESVPLVPEDAWLEGLVNAAVHRSYSLAGDHVRSRDLLEPDRGDEPRPFPGSRQRGQPAGCTSVRAQPEDRASLRGSELRPGARRGHPSDVRGDAAGRPGRPALRGDLGQRQADALAEPVDRSSRLAFHAARDSSLPRSATPGNSAPARSPRRSASRGRPRAAICEPCATPA